MDENKMAIVPPTTAFRNNIPRRWLFSGGDRVVLVSGACCTGTVYSSGIACFGVKSGNVYGVHWDGAHEHDRRYMERELTHA